MKAISVQGLSKIYKSGLKALEDINLEISVGEIFALLGPNGAGKTTLIGTVCGIVNPSSGSVSVMGYDNLTEYRKARSLIGLVPQELATDSFESVWNTVSFSRGLFGFSPNPELVENILADLSLLDKKDSQIRKLSGGMKRRVMIAKALAHEPKILFLDEPTAGVDVELRKSMWALIGRLRGFGVTVVLTTHYIEEAEEMADRVGIIDKGKIILVEEKNSLMKKLGGKELTISLAEPMGSLPPFLYGFGLKLSEDSKNLIFCYDSGEGEDRISALLESLKKNNIKYKDLDTKQSSLEDIFVSLVGKDKNGSVKPGIV